MIVFFFCDFGNKKLKRNQSYKQKLYLKNIFCVISLKILLLFWIVTIVINQQKAKNEPTNHSKI